MSLSPDIESKDIIFAILYFVIIGFIAYLLFLKRKEEKNRISWFETKKGELNLTDLDDVQIFFESNFYNFLVYTKEEYIYVINKGSRSIEKILKKDILDIDVEVYVSEKNVKRLVALTSTYDKFTRLDSIVFKITTEKNTYKIPCMLNGKDGNKIVVLNKNTIIDDVNRCKLIIEKDIEKINNVNI